jgi:uncharacterized protein (TIGR03435 family)
MVRATLVQLMIAALSVPALAQDAFDVASVKKVTERPSLSPSRTRGAVFSMTNVTVSGLIQFAYDIGAHEVVGGPDWVRQDRFAVEARASAEVPVERMRVMVQSLLKDRFGLVVHREPRAVRHMVLLPATPEGRLGPGLEPCADPTAKPSRFMPPRGSTSFDGRCADVSALATFLSNVLQTPVVDRSGLAGTWNYRIVFLGPRQAVSASPEPASAPALETALKELGFTLEPGRDPIEAVVIDSIHVPTEN